MFQFEIEEFGFSMYTQDGVRHQYNWEIRLEIDDDPDCVVFCTHRTLAAFIDALDAWVPGTNTKLAYMWNNCDGESELYLDPKTNKFTMQEGFCLQSWAVTFDFNMIGVKEQIVQFLRQILAHLQKKAEEDDI